MLGLMVVVWLLYWCGCIGSVAAVVAWLRSWCGCCVGVVAVVVWLRLVPVLQHLATYVVFSSQKSVSDTVFHASCE